MKKLIVKWNNMPNAVKASLAFTFSSFLVKGISFLTTPIFTRIMDQTQYGIISTYNAWSAVIEVFAVLGMTSAGILNVGLNEYQDSRSKYLSNITIIGNVTTVVTFGILFIINHLGNGQVILPDKLLILMFLHFLFYPAQIYWLTRQRYELKYKAATAVSVLSVLLGQVLAIIFVLDVSMNQGETKILASEVGQLVVAIPVFSVIIKQGKSLFDKHIWKQVFCFALPLIPHYLAQHLMTSADRIMISKIISTADTGIYNLVYNVGWLATLVWSAINASLTPFLYDKMNTKSFQQTKNVTKLLIVLYSVICFVAVILAPEVVKILATKDYYDGVYAIPPIVGVAFLSGFYNLYATVEFYYKKTKTIASATILASLINVFLNYVMIRKWSYVGASYATLISYIILILLHYRGYKKLQSEPIYDDSFFLKLALLFIGACLFFTVLYQYDIIRYCLLVIITVVIFIRRNIVKKYIIKVKDGLKLR